MNRCLDSNLDVLDRPVGSPERSPARAASTLCMGLSGALNARAVEFIAKPNKIEELRDCLCGPVNAFLDRQTGFSGALLLTSHKEPRLVVVLSLWQTEEQSSQNRWEEMSEVRRSVSRCVDLCSRVHTYEAAFPKLRQIVATETEMQVC